MKKFLTTVVAACMIGTSVLTAPAASAIPSQEPPTGGSATWMISGLQSAYQGFYGLVFGDAHPSEVFGPALISSLPFYLPMSLLQPVAEAEVAVSSTLSSN